MTIKSAEGRPRWFRAQGPHVRKKIKQSVPSTPKDTNANAIVAQSVASRSNQQAPGFQNLVPFSDSPFRTQPERMPSPGDAVKTGAELVMGGVVGAVAAKVLDRAREGSLLFAPWR